MEWYILALISAILSAIAAIAEKKSLFKVNPLEFAALVSVFSFLFSLPFLFFFNIQTITGQALLVLFFKCIFNAIAFYSIMEALKRLDISNSLPLMELSPAIVAIVAFIFLKETLNPLQIFGLALLVVGTYLINLKEKNTVLAPFKVFIKSRGHNFILLALASYTVTSVLDKVLVGSTFKMVPQGFMFFQHLFMMIIFFIPLIIRRRTKTFASIKNSMKLAGALILFVGLLTVLYRYSQILAVKSGKVALALAIKRLSVFFACIIGGKLFNEKNLLLRVSATIVLIGGVTLIILA